VMHVYMHAIYMPIDVWIYVCIRVWYVFRKASNGQIHTSVCIQSHTHTHYVTDMHGSNAHIHHVDTRMHVFVYSYYYINMTHTSVHLMQNFSSQVRGSPRTNTRERVLRHIPCLNVHMHTCAYMPTHRCTFAGGSLRPNTQQLRVMSDAMTSSANSLRFQLQGMNVHVYVDSCQM
jgi:hypothetical protein